MVYVTLRINRLPRRDNLRHPPPQGYRHTASRSQPTDSKDSSPPPAPSRYSVRLQAAPGEPLPIAHTPAHHCKPGTGVTPASLGLGRRHTTLSEAASSERPDLSRGARIFPNDCRSEVSQPRGIQLSAHGSPCSSHPVHRTRASRLRQSPRQPRISATPDLPRPSGTIPADISAAESTARLLAPKDLDPTTTGKTHATGPFPGTFF